MEWTLGFAFAEIRNPSAGAVPFPSTSQQQKDKEGKGQEGKEEEEITPVYRKVLGAVFDGAAAMSTMKKIAEAASKALHSPPAAMEFCEGFADRVIESRR